MACSRILYIFSFMLIVFILQVLFLLSLFIRTYTHSEAIARRVPVDYVLPRESELLSPQRGGLELLQREESFLPQHRRVTRMGCDPDCFKYCRLVVTVTPFSKYQRRHRPSKPDNNLYATILYNSNSVK